MNLFDREIFYSIRDKITVRVCNRLLVIECDCVLLLMLSIRRYFFIRKGAETDISTLARVPRETVGMELI